MVKVTTTVSINPEIYRLSKLKGLNISSILNDALCKKLGITAETSPELREIVDKTQTDNLKEFLETTGSSVVQNLSALKFWSGRTGKTMEELIILKRDYHGGAGGERL